MIPDVLVIEAEHLPFFLEKSTAFPQVEKLDYYSSVKSATHSQAPNAKDIYEDLAKRYPGRKKKQPTPPVEAAQEN